MTTSSTSTEDDDGALLATNDDSYYKPGDVVLTIYGVGVIVEKKKKKQDDFYSVRLWRIPGRSVASSTLAFLRPSTIEGRLPVAPGMVTSLKKNSPESAKTDDDDDVLVHCYYRDRKTFLVSRVTDSMRQQHSPKNDLFSLSSHRRSSVSIMSEAAAAAAAAAVSEESEEASAAIIDVEYTQVTASDLSPAPSAKFYPVLQALMIRGDQTAVAATNVLRDEKTKRLVDQTGRALQQQVDRLMTPNNNQQQADIIEAGSQKLETLADSVQAAAPRAEENVHQIIQYVKDKEMTVLLETAKKRLEQLVQTDLSAATQQVLEKTGIRIYIEETTTETTATSSSSSSFAASLESSRKAALSAIEQLLRQEAELLDLTAADLDKIRGDLSTNFAHAFDSLATAAKSDRSLNVLFESIAEKTSEWQEATGRLLQTRSAGLFLEGASRLQARAAAILKKNNNQSGGQGLEWAAAVGEIGSKLTKSFTEGDAALARLKSIELGDAVKNRLIEAIEIRSESLGGLDGIIAGALTTVQEKSAGSGDQMRDLLTGLQKTNKRLTDAHETLISVLSSSSKYRDTALLRIEDALCMLQNQFGEELSPEEIATIAQGEGGTAKIFEPIARRAMKQIDQQLDLAESKTTDPTVLEILKRVRKIMSGELTLSSVMDEIIGVLNDDRVVAASETLVQHSERVLDAIEGASGSRAMNDAIKLVEKAGVTKDTVMQELEKLDVNDLLDTAGSAVTDETARRKLLSSATDTALDFVLRILPSMPVPPFEGVKDGLVYHISNLSMEGFKVRKEDIQIELAGMRATRRASTMRKSSTVSSSSVMLEDNRSERSDVSFEVEEVHSSVKATELLIIDIQNISAVLENAVWSFEQTYMPYLKGRGMADVRLSGGAIRLQFELRRRRKDDDGCDGKAWEPVLCLHDRTCSISEVELTLQGEGRLTWILNKLAAIFKGPLRDYVVRTIVRVLTTQSGWILERLNMILAPYWDLILRTAHLQMDDLVEADEKVIVKETSSTDRTFVELVWRERLPLGMNLLLNDESGLLKVVDFPRGSQARLVCEKRNLDPELFKGATIVAVNGSSYDDQDELFDALKDPSRPKTVRFEFPESEDAERIRLFVEGEDKTGDDAGTIPHERVIELRHVEFLEPSELGIEFGNALDNFGLVVRGFIEGDDGIVLAAERSDKILPGDLLVKINDECVVSTDGTGRARAVQLLEAVASKRPLTLAFSDPYLHHEVIIKPLAMPDGSESSGGPAELLLSEQAEGGSRRVVISGFDDVSGKAESSGILIGDYLVFVNGVPVGADCRWLGVSPSPTLVDVLNMIMNKESYPMGLTFARPRQSETRWSSPGHGSHALSDDEADTMCVTIDRGEELGCVFDQSSNCDITIADFEAVPGVFQLSLAKYKDRSGKISLSIDSINGQFVPSYASADMIKNAISRSWKADERIELWLSDDELKKWIHAQVKQAGNSGED